MNHERREIEVPIKHDERARRRTLWAYWSKQPVATVLWIGLLVWCVRTLPNTYSSDPPGAPTTKSAAGRSVAIPLMYIIRNDGVLTGVDGATRTSADMVTDRIVGMAWYAYRLRPEFEMSGVIITGDVRPDEMDTARGLYIDFLAKRPERYWERVAGQIKGGNEINTLGFKVRWLAQVMASIMIVPLLLRSLLWLAPIAAKVLEPISKSTLDPEERERLRRRKALGKGLCPGCGYNISGLPKRRCPECNETWAVTELPR